MFGCYIDKNYFILMLKIIFFLSEIVNYNYCYVYCIFFLKFLLIELS